MNRLYFRIHHNTVLSVTTMADVHEFYSIIGTRV